MTDYTHYLEGYSTSSADSMDVVDSILEDAEENRWQEIETLDEHINRFLDEADDLEQGFDGILEEIENEISRLEEKKEKLEKEGYMTEHEKAEVKRIEERLNTLRDRKWRNKADKVSEPKKFIREALKHELEKTRLEKDDNLDELV